MNTKKWTRYLAWGVLGLVSQQAYSQATQANNAGGFGSYLGWNAVANQILEVKNDANQPIEWYTNAIRRMTLLPDATYTIGLAPPQVRDGSLLLSPDVDQFYLGALGPYSLFHMAAAANSTQQNSHRGWMDIGITFTGNDDHGYIGQKHGDLDFTDMVIHWSDNPGEFLKDRLRFIFTSGFDAGATSGAQSEEGLEFMRFFPSRYEEPLIGVGDFFAANLADPSISEPTERLDIVNGRVRVRELPAPAGEATGAYKVMVVDDTPYPDAQRGVVKWVAPTSLPGGSADCDWEVTATADVVTAYQPTPPAGCPAVVNNVGIGTATPTAKLEVQKTANSGGPFDEGIRSDMFTTGPNNVGGRTFSLTPNDGNRNIGWQGHATRASRNWGVDGNAAWSSLVNQESWSDARVVGVRGFADGNFALDPDNIRGVWGIGINPQTGGMAWGGWFDGRLWASTGVVEGPSDEQLKQNIVPLSGALGVIAQLGPKAFEFRVEEFPTLALDSRQRYGFIAQEVEEVLPALVSDIQQPAHLDEMGNELNAGVAFKAMNTTDLIPWVVAAIQEQQAQISEQAALIQQMQEQLGDCCSQLVPDGKLRGMEPATPALGERLLTIVPNPVSAYTAIGYTLERGGRVMLLLTGSDGRQMQVLHEGRMEAGSYQHDWHTAQLAAGMYHITLLLDGEPLVKRAVKL